MTSSRMNGNAGRAGAGRRAGRLQRAQGSRLPGLGRGRHDLRQPRRIRPRDQTQCARGRRGEGRRALYSVDDDLQQADLNQNNATLANAQQTYDRAASLSKTGSGTQANLDSAVSALRVAEARVNTSQTRLARRSGFAPVAGTIQQIYFREGEMVPAQRPVLSIMPPGNMKLRFFVPETELPKLAIGDEVKVTCDNCAADLTAKIYFIATTAEYTPPVIYSLDERNKLVYLIQARPSRPDSLRVGQPISVFLNAPTPVADKR